MTGRLGLNVGTPQSAIDLTGDIRLSGSSDGTTAGKLILEERANTSVNHVSFRAQDLSTSSEYSWPSGGSGTAGFVLHNSASDSLYWAEAGSTDAGNVNISDAGSYYDSTTVEGALQELKKISYAQIAQTVTFNGNSNDRIDTLSIDDTWNILSRPENFAVIDTTLGDWNADSLAVGKLVYLGSKTKKFRVSVSFSGEMLSTGDASWVGVYKNSAIENHSIKYVWFENIVVRDYHFSCLVELSTNDTLDVRFRDDTAGAQTVYLYSCNISLNEL